MGKTISPDCIVPAHESDHARCFITLRHVVRPKHEHLQDSQKTTLCRQSSCRPIHPRNAPAAYLAVGRRYGSAARTKADFGILIPGVGFRHLQDIYRKCPKRMEK